jgi:uracil phosphoribosyltransferase
MATSANGVTVVDHPLVQHKLTLMREKDRSTKSFRQLLNEIGMLLCYEVTRDLPTEMIEIETPLQRSMQPVISGKKLVFAPILRAGVGFLDGMLELVPAARVAHIGLYRDPQTLQAVEYYFKAPLRHRRPHDRGDGPDAGDGELGRGGGRSAEGARRQGSALRLPAGGA